MNIKSAMFAALVTLFVPYAESAQAAPVVVTGSVTGSSGDWVYNLSVSNNLGGTNDVYFWGVALPTTNITGVPSGWYAYGDWSAGSNAFYGGPAFDYKDAWDSTNLTTINVTPGQTLGGFQVTDTSVNALSNVEWFAFAFNGTYTGGGNYNTSSNPGFDGVVSFSSAVPEPSTWAMMILGFFGIGFMAYRRRNATLSVA